MDRRRQDRYAEVGHAALRSEIGRPEVTSGKSAGDSTSSTTTGEGRAIMNAYREITRKPTTPGEILHEEFLKPLGMSQRELAAHLGCDVKVVNRIVNGRTSV